MVETARAKLEEAKSALVEMCDQEQRAFGDRPRFDHSLSAFLNAGRSVDYRLQCEYKATYLTWRETWNAQHPAEDRLLKWMHKKRAAEVHGPGSGRIVKLKQKTKVGVGSSYSDKSGTLESWGTPSPLIGVDTGVTIHVPQYFFDLDGAERPVIEVCAEYLTVLEQMVAQYTTHLRRVAKEEA